MAKKEVAIRRLTDLPKGVKDNLPKDAQKIYKEVFNNAYEQYKDPKKRTYGGTRAEAAARVAWSAVKKEYKKVRDKWVKK